MKPLRTLRLFAAMSVAAVLGSVMYALAGSNSVAATSAGAGSGAISGYAVTGIGYTLDSADPANIDSVAFTITPAAASLVKVKLGGSWYSCTNAAGSVSCSTSGASLADATSLTVVAHQ